MEIFIVFEKPQKKGPYDPFLFAASFSCSFMNRKYSAQARISTVLIVLISSSTVLPNSFANRNRNNRSRSCFSFLVQSQLVVLFQHHSFQ